VTSEAARHAQRHTFGAGTAPQPKLPTARSRVNRAGFPGPTGRRRH